LQFQPQRLVAVDRSENGQFFLERELQQLAPQLDLDVLMADIGDGARMEQILQRYRPEIIFHAAAYKHVPLMESNVGEAVKNISLATRRLADLAEKHHVASFVMISTDKAVNPTSVMGTCKRVAELYVQALSHHARCRFVTVRFGNVLDSAGSVVPVFREQIARGGPVTVTHPQMTRYFMTIPEASQLVIEAGTMGQGGEIFVLDMGEPIRIVDLATDMIHLSGLRAGVDIEIEYVGVRPGEKLFEELHVDGERHLKTRNPKIRVAESPPISLTQMMDSIRVLESVSGAADETVLAELVRIVPQYRGPTTAEQVKRAA
jgi:FlaA1/EpsC-like NDP-sugar epimerase